MSQLTTTTKTRPEIRRAICQRMARSGRNFGRLRLSRQKHIKRKRAIGRGPVSELSL